MRKIELANFIEGRVGRFLRASRESARYTIPDAAKALGFSEALLQQYELGKNVPAFEIVRISEFYNRSHDRAAAFFFRLQLEVYRRMVRDPGH